MSAVHFYTFFPKTTSLKYNINPLIPEGDQHVISPFNIKHRGHENKGNDNQLKNLLIARQILLASTLGNV